MDPQTLPCSWVEPAGPVHPSLIRLSALDNLTTPVYPSPTEFFPLKPNTDPRQLYEDCKRGLARYIYQHPHLCGRIFKDETGRNSIEIRPMPYAGVNFEFHDHRDMKGMPSYEEFRRFGWPFGDGDQDGLSKLRQKVFPSAQAGDPILITRFNVIKGGIVLTMSIAHVMCDLVQFKDLMGSWARNTCAVANARTKNQPEPPLPQQVAANLMDRSPLMPNVQIEHDLEKLAARAANLPHWTMVDPRDPRKMGKTIDDIFTKARLTGNDLANFSEDKLRGLSTSVWTFPQSSIRKLKLAADRVSPRGTKLSSIDCLTAFAWQRFFAAKWAPGVPGAEPIPKTTRIVYAGSVRTRLTPPLPLDYMPACVDLFPVTANTDSFTSTAPEALAKVATMIRSSNNNWSEEVFCEMIEIAQMHPMNPGLVPNGPLDALVTDHTRLSSVVLEDWGPGLGRCEAYREPYLGRELPRGEITLLPGCDNGKVDVMFAGEAVVLERLRNDKDMNAVASCQFIMDDFIKRAAKNLRSAKL
ncbi:hypothetical protein N7448_002376 [Penicillium atrosanguineum]|uniref:Trichothecene 3-O-acetyltransferase n=1 Tax=Penicillium atrosanguineum TaxID=1132637 RepID=A0A9W9L925_9EURO|nr:hypothetical protein N7526_006825 [Penicillium atrosanguineum]KAJ5144984.1 hypothetical protein N7448_002376 [Penicillium atrosanguineum]KAJ5311418.1 hypothetical protein N7476_007278 [Penicillium atrosanguineum]